jgi:predicted RecB family nuclease
MTTTDVIFAAFLQCETKAYLLGEGVAGARSEVDSLQQHLSNRYKRAAADWLKLKVQKGEPHVGRPSSLIREQGFSTIVFKPLIEASGLQAQPDALSSKLSDQSVGSTPVRFVRTEKLSRADKLLLAFDALAIHRVTGCLPRSGKLIHGSQFRMVTVPLAKLLEIVEAALTKMKTHQASRVAPPLVLNKHCSECEFRSRCREVAVEKDDLSLLGNMTAKERQKLNRRGIFTVTQLSYTFRPRRRQALGAARHEPALKALAIRKDRTHVVGAPDFGLAKGAIYLDVEGVPDTDFYYLIGLRHRGIEGD